MAIPCMWGREKEKGGKKVSLKILKFVLNSLNQFSPLKFGSVII